MRNEDGFRLEQSQIKTKKELKSVNENGVNKIGKDLNFVLVPWNESEGDPDPILKRDEQRDRGENGGFFCPSSDRFQKKN